jgi:hypothetical protein
MPRDTTGSKPYWLVYPGIVSHDRVPTAASKELSRRVVEGAEYENQRTCAPLGLGTSSDFNQAFVLVELLNDQRQQRLQPV